MKNKIYYLTRSYAPYQSGGGPLMRRGAVKHLIELGWDVVVILPNYKTQDVIIENNIIQIPFINKHIPQLASLLTRFGMYEDSIDKWVENAFQYLKQVVTKSDIVLATSGGELGTIKLGSLLKGYLNCKFVVNFRDPTNYSLVNGMKVSRKFHVPREKYEFKYLKNSDAIVTSSNSNKNSLENKYAEFKGKIFNNYFGFIKMIDLSNLKKTGSKKIRIAYSGSMLSKVQKPELLYWAYEQLKDKENIELYFIGNIESNKVLKELSKKNNDNIKFINHLPHSEYLDFMCKNIDIGFVCLSKDYYGACVPSKLYEYINLDLPIIGAFPDGDAKDIINNQEYGIACDYRNLAGLSDAIVRMRDRNMYAHFKSKILRDKKNWSMSHTILVVDEICRRLINSEA